MEEKEKLRKTEKNHLETAVLLFVGVFNTLQIDFHQHQNDNFN